MIKKIFINFILMLSMFSFSSIVFAWWAIDFWAASSATNEIKTASVWAKTWTFEEQITKTSTNVLKTLKIVVWAVLVVYIIYAWVMMIWAMWAEDELKKSKNSIWYAIVWLLFLNIPWALYQALSWKATTDDITSGLWEKTTIYNRNIFMNSSAFWDVLWGIVSFLQVSIVALAVFIFVYQWIKLITAWWQDEVIKEAKNKILYSLMWLLFLWVIEAWRVTVFTSNFDAGKDIFTRLSNLALFFAGPIAIFFICLAGYYYITAAWEDEKIKKAKSIVFNTVIATLILLWMYTFLLDIKEFVTP